MRRFRLRYHSTAREQKNSQLEVQVKASINGIAQVLRTTLPQQIVRNYVYTLRLKGTGAKLEADILTNQWENGDQENGSLNERISIDLQSLPAGVTCEGNQIFISHLGSSFTLRLNKREEVDIRISQSDSHFQVLPTGNPTSFQVSAEHVSPGVHPQIRNL